MSTWIGLHNLALFTVIGSREIGIKKTSKPYISISRLAPVPGGIMAPVFGWNRIYLSTVLAR